MAKISLKSNKTDEQIKKERYQALMDSVQLWTAYYRSNPSRFVEDFLNVKLKPFQKILLYEMCNTETFVFIASRGLGKSFLMAVYAVTMAILYPGINICMVSKTLAQAKIVLEKITNDLVIKHSWGSDLLRNEIKNDQSKGKDPFIEFKNGSKIFAKVANDNARGVRSQINCYDEYVIMDLDVVRAVHDKFLTDSRHPAYLDNPKYADLEEPNKRIYLSSPKFKGTKAFTVQIDALKKMLMHQGAFTCAIPYQCGVKEHIIQKQTIKNELESEDFDPIKFSQEYEAKWYGSNAEAFFDFNDISKRRVIKDAFPSIDKLINKNEDVPVVDYRCERILSVDVALMASTKKKNNDASSFMINDAIITKNDKYVSNIVYTKNYEGLTTDELGLEIMRYFYLYRCTQLVIDSNGIGLGVADYIMQDHIDPVTGELYKAVSCCNDDEMAKRCKVLDAKKVMWSIKANAVFNSQIAKLLRNGFKQGTVRLLVDEYEAEDILQGMKNFSSMSPHSQNEFKLPYLNTSLIVNELVKLDYEVVGSNIKIKERSGNRKDRYSSLAYNIYVTKELERKLKPQREVENILLSLSRPPKRQKSIFS